MTSFSMCGIEHGMSRFELQFDLRRCHGIEHSDLSFIEN